MDTGWTTSNLSTGNNLAQMGVGNSDQGQSGGMLSKQWWAFFL